MFLERLSRIANRISGASALILVSSDGIPVESVSLEDGLDLEMLSAEFLALIRSMSDNHRELDVGSVRQVTVSTGRYQLLASSLTDDYYLLLVTQPQAVLGRARFELRRAPALFVDDLA